MRNPFQKIGASLMESAFGGGASAEQAKLAELDRLSRLDLQHAQIGNFNAQATAAREKSRLDRDKFDAEQQARNLRMDPSFLSRIVGMRLPEVDPGQVSALVRRGMGGPFEMPAIDPMQSRVAAETMASIFAGGAADGPTNAEQMANVVTGAGRSAQRLHAPQIAAEDPITATFMLNAGTNHQAPALYGALPNGLGTFGTLTGATNYDAGMKGVAISKSEAEAAKHRADATQSYAAAASSSATAAKTRQETERGTRIWDADRGGFIDWRTGAFVPAAGIDGAPVGPKPNAGKAPTGYRWTEDGLELEPIPGGPKDTATAPSKPLPAAALRMQKDEMEAIGIAAGIEADLGKVDEQLAAGKLSLGPVENWKSRAQNWAGVSSENSRNFASMTATLEKLRNDSLRLNKGVQTEGDAVRAWNELMANQNDPQLVRQRIAEIRAINRRAVNLRQMNIDAIRQNYGAGPLDTTQIRNLPAAVGARPDATSPVPQGAAPSVAQPASATPAARPATRGASGGWDEAPADLPQVMNVADYEALPPGAEYLDPDGKRRRKGQ